MTTKFPPSPQPSTALREREKSRARALRVDSTDAERLIWRHLRDRRLGGFKFRCQHPVGSYFADFACLEAMLIVELDGGQHFKPAALLAAERRTAALKKHGFDVLRFDNGQVLSPVEGVLTAILDRLESHHPHPNPLPQAGEGARQIRS